MNLTGRQQAELIEEIDRHFIYAALSVTLRKIEVRLASISADTGMLEVAQSVVDDAIQKLWLRELVDVLLQDRPGQPVFQKLQALFEAAEPAGSVAALPHHERYLLPGQLPFLDRKQFRTIANHFNRSGRRILTVKGVNGSGKTYSKEFMFHLARARKDDKVDVFTPVWVDLAPSSAIPDRQPTNGLTVITEIVNQISGIELPEKYETSFNEQKEQAATWAKNVGSWLTGALSETEDIYWLIIDGFDEGPIAHSAMLVIDDLIGRVGNNLSAMRLILIGFNDEGFDAYRVRRHEDEARDLTDPRFENELYEELVAFLLQADALTYENVPEGELSDRLAEDAADLLQEIDPNQSGQMQLLADALERKALSISQGAAP